MASRGVIATPELVGETGEQLANSQRGPVVFRRPSELAVLSDTLIRSIFSAGLLVSCIFTAYAVILSAGQTGDRQIQGAASCLTILAFELSALMKHRVAFAFLRRHNAAILFPAALVGAGGWLTGANNDQYFFVLPILLGVIGVAVEFRWICLAALVASAGMLAPAPTDSGQMITTGFSLVVPPIFWLTVDSLARFMLHLQRIVALASGPQATVGGSPKDSGQSADSGRRSNASKDPAAISELAHSLHDWEIQRARTTERVADSEVKLTARQLQAVFYCCDGLSDSEIADAMAVSVRQVRRFLDQARDRADCETREQLAAWAITLRLIPLEPHSYAVHQDHP